MTVKGDALGKSGGFYPIKNRILDIGTANLVRYYMMNETSGTTMIDYGPNGSNGTYNGPTLNSGVHMLDGQPAPSFDGVNDECSFLSNLNTDWPAANRTEGLILIWVKAANIGVWDDATQRYLFRIRTDANNQILFRKKATTNELIAIVEFSGKSTSPGVTITPSADWMSFIIRWWDDGVLTNAEIYQNGSLLNSGTANNDVWSGDVAIADIAGAFTSGNVWDGWANHFALYDSKLTAVDISNLSKRF
jgi:hypothetical protein